MTNRTTQSQSTRKPTAISEASRCDIRNVKLLRSASEEYDTSDIFFTRVSRTFKAIDTEAVDAHTLC